MINNEKLKLLTNIREKITAYFPTDDNRLDPDYIWEQCKIIRNIFIEKLFQEDKRNAEEFYSRLVLDVLLHDDEERVPNPLYNPTVSGSVPYMDNPDYEPDLASLRRIRIPSLININGNIRYVGSTDRSVEYARTGMDSFFRLSGRDFTSSKIFYLPFSDRIFFSSTPVNSIGVAYDQVMVWALLEDPEDDPNWNSADNGLVPKKYQLLLEDMVSDNILKYARGGILSRENDATDRETTQGR